MSRDAAAFRYCFDRFELHPGDRTLMHDGKTVPVSPRAFDVLVALLERAGELVSKDELLERVWEGLVVEENNLQVQVSALRKLLGAEAIATVPRNVRSMLDVVMSFSAGILLESLTCASLAQPGRSTAPSAL